MAANGIRSHARTNYKDILWQRGRGKSFDKILNILRVVCTDVDQNLTAN